MEAIVEAKHWTSGEGASVRCGLCPHGCVIKDGGRGACGIRVNREGRLIAAGYGIYPAVHLDPIEKKPLNHFLPGSRILSVGSIGCNLKCRHCQNWSLSRELPDGMEAYTIPPDILVDRALDRESIGVAFTYNEPTINFEYIMDVAPRLRKKGAKVVLVTNGYLNKGPWSELMEHTDAANVDVKGFTEEFYSRIAGGKLQPVLDNVKTAVDMGVHLEIAYLVIPGHNDDDIQVRSFIDWVLGKLDDQVPLHFNRFHPDHEMLDVPSTPHSTLERIRRTAREMGSKHVFLGNLGGGEHNDTYCPGCGKKVIARDLFNVSMKGLRDGRCTHCKTAVSGVWGQ